jgi:hypothetical protein
MQATAGVGCENRQSIVSGSKRHFEELKVQLIAVGYEIVPVGAHPYCAQLNKLAAG